MLKPLPRNVLWVLAVCLFAALQAGAQTVVPAGAGTLSGTQRLKASGCGKDTGAVSVPFTLVADGTWSADLDGDVYTGTSQTRGRVVRLSFDAASQAELVAELADEASSLCQDTVTISSLSVSIDSYCPTPRLTVMRRSTLR